MLDNRHILLGVSGGVAAYKAVDLASRLISAGAQVKTVMTRAACRFVGPKSFEAVTQSPVFTTMWSTSEAFKISHIALADWADIVVVAPATANVIAKTALGICDDLLSTTLCTCWARPMLFAPAMNTRMWENPAVQANVETLKNRGVQWIGPASGRLACGTEGVGRMSEPQDIMEAVKKIALNNQDKTN
ncbi:MAG: bifunctional phosphopantothenoylcysteine decarboxylase/phosphopantothenate--cysteine ligase CoaBC [Sedimentisphaerales bacterium]